MFLASLKFDKIGSLREDANGNFFVGPYNETNVTAHQQNKAVAYNQLEPHHQGPFSSIPDWYNAMAEFNRKYAVVAMVQNREELVADYELLAELADHFVIPEFKDGPFVIDHNNLSIDNIFVSYHLFSKLVILSG